MTRFVPARLVLPEQAALRREHVLPADRLAPGSWTGYDTRTLAYDVVHMPHRRSVVLVCPRLLNLWPEISGFRIDGKAAKIRARRVHRRWEEIWLTEDAEIPKVLEVRLARHSLSTGISQRSTLFDGCRVLLTLQKDEPLDWIMDWAEYAVRLQGADAVLVIDNGSSAYALDDLEGALRSVPGLRASAVLSLDFPYGKVQARHGSAKGAQFLQTAAWNLARYRFLDGADGVLRLDVDEVAVSNGTSVFDEASASVSATSAFLAFGATPKAGLAGRRGMRTMSL